MASAHALFYAVAMAVSGTGSLLLGRIFDRAGISVLIPLTIVAAVYAPLVFVGGFWSILVGVSLWGLGMGVQESLIPAASPLWSARTAGPPPAAYSPASTALSCARRAV